MKKLHVKALVCGLLAMMLLLGACTSGSGSGTSTEGTTAPGNSTTGGTTTTTQAADWTDIESAKDTLVLGIGSEPTYLAAGYVTEKMGCLTATNMYDTLIHPRDDGGFDPWLAESWEQSDDGLEITFKIREGVKFQNGEPMTIDDVVWSFDYWLRNSSNAVSSLTGMDKVIKVDENHMKITYTSYSSTAMVGLANYNCAIVSQKLWEEIGDEGLKETYLGTGPYSLVDRKSGDYLQFEAFDDYWAGKPKIKNVTLKIIADTNTAVIALQTGELDAYYRLGLNTKNEIESTPTLVWYDSPTPSTIYVCFNLSNPTYQDKNVRLGIAHCINKDEMLFGAVDGLGKKMDGGVFPDTINDFYGPIEDYPQDFDIAKQYLAEAGYTESNKLNINIVTSEGSLYLPANEILQAQLNKSGVINATLEKMENASFTEAVMTSMSYEVTCFNITFYQDPTTKMENHYYTDSPRPYHGLTDPKLDELGRGYTYNVDRAAASQSLKEFVQYIHDEAYMLPLYCTYVAAVGQQDLKGFEIPGVYEACVRWDTLYWE